MKNIELKKATSLRGEITVPGDKSISHRGIMFGAISKGDTHIKGFLDAADCRSTIECFRRLGVDIEKNGSEVVVHGKGLRGLSPLKDTLDVGNSGTTMRLISGILAGSGINVSLDGDSSIRKRPMKRIMLPLGMMGADIVSKEDNGCAPLIFKGGELKGIDYDSPVASAQVKSCILLAGLYADGSTSVTEPYVSRDHTERMLKAFGADLSVSGSTVSVNTASELYGCDITVPGDISSAAYFIAAGLIHKDAKLVIKNVNINPTRAGILSIVKAMGGKLSIENERLVSGEPVADLVVCSSSLSGTEISGEIIPTLIDEIPIIAVMAAYAKGRTVIKDAAELKVKESDRIASICDNLKKLGADVTPTDDGMIITGQRPLLGSVIKTDNDHRIAMSFAVLSLMVDGIVLDNPDCVNISYENFYDTLFSVSKM